MERQLILIRFENPTSGIWRFNVYERRGLNLGFNIWLPMDGFISDDTYFIRSDPNTTILTLGNAENVLTVTAYNDADDSLYLNSSRGYTVIGRVKPEVAAPGVNIIGPTLTGGFAIIYRNQCFRCTYYRNCGYVIGMGSCK